MNTPSTIHDIQPSRRWSTRRVGRTALAALAATSFALGAAACSDDDGDDDDLDNPVDGVDDQIDDGAGEIQEEISEEVSG